MVNRIQQYPAEVIQAHLGCRGFSSKTGPGILCLKTRTALHLRPLV